MSTRQEWATTSDALYGVITRAESAEYVGQTIDTSHALQLCGGSGDGLVIEGDPGELVAFIDQVHAHVHAFLDTPPRVELIVGRDPDGDTSTRLFLDGRETPTATVTVDAGAGWTRGDWNAHRESAVADASCPAVAAAIGEAFTDPPGEHITG